MALSDFVMTIDSDEEEPLSPGGSKASTHVLDETTLINSDFCIDLSGDAYDNLLGEAHLPKDSVKIGSKQEHISVDDIIAKRKSHEKHNPNFQAQIEAIEEHSGDASSVSGDSRSQPHNESQLEEDDPLATSDEEDPEKDLYLQTEDESKFSHRVSSEEDGSEDETQAEKDRKSAFFDSEMEPSEAHHSFLTMNISRPILKATTALGFQKPTPIQAAAIPVGLLGKDVVGGAVTGSGKTAAFMIPMLERLLYRERGKKAAATRCLVLVPTRELAIQCFDVGTKLASYTDIQLCLIVGGLSVKSQEVALRSRPDIIIATPGRLIDHIRNSPTFTLDTLDILVLDEADRMLSDGFADELTEIVKSCPASRQTMLFSATMTDSVDELVRMSLHKPVRLFVDPKRSTARGLVQEFVRVRAGKEMERSAVLVSLCRRTFNSGVIVFLRSKKLAHQMRTAFTLLGMSCEELHGNLSQEQRLKALQKFRDGSADFLMATDLASRGLDIKGIKTVINYDMPGQLSQYLHRVGRTARAGQQGHSVTLVGENDRKMLKAVIKHSTGKDQVRHRLVPPAAVQKWAQLLDGMKEEIAQILVEEVEEKELRQAEMELTKGQNLMEHEAEIFARPARTWFQTGKLKRLAEATSKDEYFSGFEGKKRKTDLDSISKASLPKRDKFSGLSRAAKRRKIANEEDNEMHDSAELKAAVRLAKKSARPSKIGIPQGRLPNKVVRRKDKKRKQTRVRGRADGSVEK